MPSEVFADETMARGMAMVAVAVDCANLDATRRALRSLLHKNQLRLHFKTESDAGRRRALDLITTLGVTATVYDASTIKNIQQARGACLKTLLSDILEHRHRRLVLELDESNHGFDVRVLQHQDHKLGRPPGLSYVHMRAAQEPLLGLPDAIAWSWARGGQWAKLVSSVITEVKTL
jgi:hypothetical protein